MDRGAIRVLNGKGGKSRVSGIDPGALAILQRWTEVRANCGHDGSRPLFCTSSGERVTNAIRQWAAADSSLDDLHRRAVQAIVTEIAERKPER